MRTALRVTAFLVLTAASLLVNPGTTAAAQTTYTVNRIGNSSDRNLSNNVCDVSTNSGNQCTLRAAIQEANDNPGFDIIKFNITSTSKVIKPGNALPPITDPVQINGYSQPGAKQNTLASGNDAVLKIIIDGIDAGAHVNGLNLQASDSAILGLVIQRFDGTGISVQGANNTIYGNFIGTTAAGTAAKGNGSGVTVGGSNNYIGSFKTYTQNVISGNDNAGVVIYGADNRVQGNHIGTTKAGGAALGNGGDGVLVSDATGARVGGTSSGERNIISGNGRHGVDVAVDSGASGAIIQGNYIGTNAAGTAAIGNAGSGVFTDALSVQIGGPTAVARNVISGNGDAGIELSDSDSNVVQGNLIGTKADGTGALGNDDGIRLLGTADDNTIGGTGSAGNVIANSDFDGILVSGGIHNTFAGNVIRNNGFYGVLVGDIVQTITGNIIFSNGNDGIQVSPGASGVRISTNQIFANTGLGIDLVGGTENAAKVTANDAGDPDTGPNGLQNFPLITSALRSTANGVTTVVVTLNSNASTQFRIELFVAVADASGNGEGQVFLGAQESTTNGSGNRTFTFTGTWPPGTVLTTTAARVSSGDTSEFGPNATVATGP